MIQLEPGPLGRLIANYPRHSLKLASQP